MSSKETLSSHDSTWPNFAPDTAEPASVNRCTDNVRRMSSVLEMRLGPLAASLDKASWLARAGNCPGFDFDADGDIVLDGADQLTHDSHQMSSSDDQLFDIFGIPIPAPSDQFPRAATTTFLDILDSQQNRQPTRPSSAGNEQASVLSSTSPGRTQVMDSSVFMAAPSPSRLDLSALLC